MTGIQALVISSESVLAGAVAALFAAYFVCYSFGSFRWRGFRGFRNRHLDALSKSLKDGDRLDRDADLEKIEPSNEANMDGLAGLIPGK